MVIAYLMHQSHISFESALQKVKERYPVLELDDFHREQLLLWEAMGARLNPAHMVRII